MEIIPQAVRKLIKVWRVHTFKEYPIDRLEVEFYRVDTKMTGRIKVVRPRPAGGEGTCVLAVEDIVDGLNVLAKAISEQCDCNDLRTKRLVVECTGDDMRCSIVPFMEGL